MIFITRHTWGAAASRGNAITGPVRTVVIHHTADVPLPCGVALSTEMATIRRIELMHVLDEAYRFLGIGYQWLITLPHGHVFEGRGWGREGAHYPTRNRTSVGIAFVGNGDTQELTPAAIEACQWLIRTGIEEGHIAPDYEILGHRDGQATQCPGDLIYSRLQELRP